MSSYPIPNVIAQHSRGERIMDVYSHLLTERIVYLGTAIDPGVANVLIAQLLHLEAESPEQEINLYINCEGFTTACDTSGRRSPPPAWDRRLASVPCCSPPEPLAGAQCFRTHGWCCTSPRDAAKGRSRT